MILKKKKKNTEKKTSENLCGHNCFEMLRFPWSVRSYKIPIYELVTFNKIETQSTQHTFDSHQNTFP